MARTGLFIVDAHHHSGSLEHLGMRIWDADLTPAELEDLELRTRVATLDATGVDQAVILPPHGYLRPEGLADTRRVNDFIAAYRDRQPDRFPAGVGVVEPIYGDPGLDELDRMKRELDLVGVSFHTKFQGVSTNSPLVLRLVQHMADLGLVPFIHALAETPDEALWRVQEVARSVPDTTVVVLDAFSSGDQGDQAIRVAAANPNMVMDTSLTHYWEPPLSSLWGIDRLIAEVGHERVVFGTDVFSHAAPRHQNRTLDAILEAGWLPEVTAAVVSGNIRRILGLG